MSVFQTTTNRSSSVVDEWGIHAWIVNPINCNEKEHKSVYWICLSADSCKSTIGICLLKKALKIAKGSTIDATKHLQEVHDITSQKSKKSNHKL
jgi:hypothetical protein